MNLIKHECQICREENLQLCDKFSQLQRVTSDCRPFNAGGKLAVCMSCGAVQKICDDVWLEDIQSIYSNYQAYELADGEEQLILDPVTGRPVKRSTVIMRELSKSVDLSDVSSVIDIGCGDGVTLEAISSVFPTWDLFGYEIGLEKEAKLREINGFKKLYTGDIIDIPGQYDLITMIHSLEHFTDPLNALKKLQSKLKPGGFLFIEVCNVDENPFDILVADHLMHFSPESLSNIVNHAGMSVVSANSDWVSKEISLVSVNTSAHQLAPIDATAVYAKVEDYAAWLTNLVRVAKESLPESGGFGVFGTSIAASWVAAQIPEKIDFFVDEDPNRIGRDYLEKPVLSPADVPHSSSVLMALAPVLANKISNRLRNDRWKLLEVSAC